MKRQSHLLTLPDTPLFCFPESVGVYTDSPEHAVSRDPGAMNNFNIHYVASGKGYVESEGQTLELRRGDAVLYFPMQRQHYYSSKDEPWDIRWVHFYGSGTSLQDYLQARGMHKSRLWRLRQAEGWETAHLELLAAAEKKRMNNPTLLSALTYAVIAEFVQQAVPYSAGKPGKPG
ncbi:AraC family ligand binding domain-containing protein, partial [Paenibacillus darwinianus]